MAPTRAGLRGQVGVDVKEARTRNVPGEIQLAAAARVSELPPAVDELVAQTYQLPAGEGGNATNAGWIT